MKLPFIDGAQLRALLPIADAIDALEGAFRSDRLPDAPPRSHLSVHDGTLLLMPAYGDGGLGVKLVTVNPRNPESDLPLIHALYVLFDGRSLAPVALFEGEALTALRTGAVSGVATRHLARDDARHLVLFGAGVQARAHLEAMRACRSLERVSVVSRTAERAEELAARARADGLEARVADAEVVADAHIVCTCTTSRNPVFDGRRLAAGAHVNAIGSFQRHTREVDDETVRRAWIVVEERAAALGEAGDLLIPIRSEVIEESDIVADLSELLRGAPVRQNREDITLFKSVGVAFEDLIVAAAAYERLEPSSPT